MMFLNVSKVVPIGDKKDIDLSSVIVVIRKCGNDRSYDDIIQSIAINIASDYSSSHAPLSTDIDFEIDDIIDIVNDNNDLVFKVLNENDKTMYYVKITNKRIIIALNVKDR